MKHTQEQLKAGMMVYSAPVDWWEIDSLDELEIEWVVVKQQNGRAMLVDATPCSVGKPDESPRIYLTDPKDFDLFDNWKEAAQFGLAKEIKFLEHQLALLRQFQKDVDSAREGP